MGTIAVDLAKYIKLLVRANCTDPEQWPQEFRAGATFLKRIRQIERDCKKEHGQWDWELLPAGLQDEYDSACAQLDHILQTVDPQPTIPLEQVLADLDRRRRLETKTG